MKEENNAQLAVEYRELAKKQLRSGDPESKIPGIQNLWKAYQMKDLDATFYIGHLMLKGVIKPAKGDPTKEAVSILYRAAQRGSSQARAVLNAYCIQQTEAKTNAIPFPAVSGPLVDFSGEKIEISRKGLLIPVDAELTYADGKNCLTLSANISFSNLESVKDPSQFTRAVLKGIMEWQGEYKVFGNQDLQVVVKLTTEDKLLDSVWVIPVDEGYRKVATAGASLGGKKKKARMDQIMEDKRSMAALGHKWTVKSPKMILIQSESGRFDEYEEIKHVAKHEFGHVLGLGDLYEEKEDSRVGVEKGTYYELDGYYLSNKFYNLVMCDHHGPISNNDIEMVVLAFQRNKMQLFQPWENSGEVSKALGRGN